MGVVREAPFVCSIRVVLGEMRAQAQGARGTLCMEEPMAHPECEGNLSTRS
jgi:hypothetical protein